MFLASGLQLLQQQRKWFSQEGKIIWAELLFKKNCLLDVKPGGKMILTASQFALRWALNETPGNDDQKTVWPLTLNRSVTQHTFFMKCHKDFWSRLQNKSLEQETNFCARWFCHILPQKECNHIIIPFFTDNCTVHQHQKLRPLLPSLKKKTSLFQKLTITN